jgi:hypothetical protein
MKSFDKLKTKLAELFQLDQADLDFGIYRIMDILNIWGQYFYLGSTLYFILLYSQLTPDFCQIQFPSTCPTQSPWPPAKRLPVCPLLATISASDKPHPFSIWVAVNGSVSRRGLAYRN